MGNRAVIAFKSDYISQDNSPAIYLYWNGGRDSVEAFLTASDLIGIGWDDPTYTCAQMAQIIGNWKKGKSFFGVSNYATLDTDNGDNGVYWVEDAKIIGREFFQGDEQNEHDQNLLVYDVIKANRCAFPEAFAEYAKNHAKVLNPDVIDEIAKATNRNDHVEALLILAAAVRADIIATQLTNIKAYREAGYLEGHVKAAQSACHSGLMLLAKDNFYNFDEICRALPRPILLADES